MEMISNLVDLLMYQVRNLYASEEQIEEVIPSLIEKANHSSLKNAIKQHAGLTQQQKQRLTQIPGIVKDKIAGSSLAEIDENASALKSKGMQGLTEEINELLGANLSDEIKDAAIIASVQKIEHYEICAYGTALAFAKQLKLSKVAALLNETLQEEYDADDLLTALAEAAINKEGLPEGFETTPAAGTEGNATGAIERDDEIEHTGAEVSERTINSPGGRAGTSHRGYGTGESRGH